MSKAIYFYPSQKTCTKPWAVSMDKSLFKTQKRQQLTHSKLLKRAIQKTAEAVVDLTGNKIPDKIKGNLWCLHK